MRRHIRTLSLAAAALALAATAPVAAGTIDREFHETFPAVAGTTLDLRHGDGDVIVEPWDEPTIDVHVRYLAEATRFGIGGSRDFSVDFETRGDDVVVTGHETGGGFSLGFSSLRVEIHRYTVRAPASVALRLSGDDGDVEIAGMRAPLDIRNDDGDVTLRDVQAPTVRIDAQDGDVLLEGVTASLDVTMDDGDVVVRDASIGDARLVLEDGLLHLEACAGAAEIDVDDADVRIDGLAGDRLVLRAQDGDIALRLDPAPGFVGDVRTDDGSVSVRLAPAASLAFELASSDGHVGVDAPAAEVTRERHRASGRIGAGDGRLTVRSADGDVSLTVGGAD